VVRYVTVAGPYRSPYKQCAHLEAHCNWHIFPSVACKHSVHLADNTAKFQNLDALSFQPPWDDILIAGHL